MYDVKRKHSFKREMFLFDKQLQNKKRNTAERVGYCKKKNAPFQTFSLSKKIRIKNKLGLRLVDLTN